MSRRLILFAACLVLVSSGTGGAAAAEHGEAEKPTGQYVDLSSIAFPVIYEGRLLNYVFATVRINLAKTANAAALREKEPYFRDALVRLAHRRPFTRLDDFTSIDVAALRTAFTPEAVRLAGAGQVLSVEVVRQASKQQYGLPKPPKAPSAPPNPAAH